jgi:hypothetical protein
MLKSTPSQIFKQQKQAAIDWKNKTLDKQKLFTIFSPDKKNSFDEFDVVDVVESLFDSNLFNVKNSEKLDLELNSVGHRKESASILKSSHLIGPFTSLNSDIYNFTENEENKNNNIIEEVLNTSQLKDTHLFNETTSLHHSPFNVLNNNNKNNNNDKISNAVDCRKGPFSISLSINKSFSNNSNLNTIVNEKPIFKTIETTENLDNLLSFHEAKNEAITTYENFDSTIETKINETVNSSEQQLNKNENNLNEKNGTNINSFDSSKNVTYSSKKTGFINLFSSFLNKSNKYLQEIQCVTILEILLFLIIVIITILFIEYKVILKFYNLITLDIVHFILLYKTIACKKLFDFFKPTQFYSSCFYTNLKVNYENLKNLAISDFNSMTANNYLFSIFIGVSVSFLLDNKNNRNLCFSLLNIFKKKANIQEKKIFLDNNYNNDGDNNNNNTNINGEKEINKNNKFFLNKMSMLFSILNDFVLKNKKIQIFLFFYLLTIIAIISIKKLFFEHIIQAVSIITSYLIFSMYIGVSTSVILFFFYVIFKLILWNYTTNKNKKLVIKNLALIAKQILRYLHEGGPYSIDFIYEEMNDIIDENKTSHVYVSFKNLIISENFFLKKNNISVDKNDEKNITKNVGTEENKIIKNSMKKKNSSSIFYSLFFNFFSFIFQSKKVNNNTDTDNNKNEKLFLEQDNLTSITAPKNNNKINNNINIDDNNSNNNIDNNSNNIGSNIEEKKFEKIDMCGFKLKNVWKLVQKELENDRRIHVVFYKHQKCYVDLSIATLPINK